MKKTILIFSLALAAVAAPPAHAQQTGVWLKKIEKTLKDSILRRAKRSMAESPVTVTAAQCPRSAGSIHDFYSEGDYWWPNPDDPSGPYIQRDGQSNPDNFTAHRKAMVRFSQIIGTLASAYRITSNEKYVTQAMVHLRAWFIDEATRMNPTLLYAQAIKGRATGRGIGIIDMIQMMEVAQGIRVIEQSKGVNQGEIQQIKNWFAQYLQWVTTHPYGIDERDAKNNHGTCWVMQVAIFAKLTGNQDLIDYCKNRFKTVLLPNQMDPDGSFPLELRRTKPYGYSLFNLDAMVSVCHILSDEKENLWDFTLPDGRSLKKAIDFMVPFVENKANWTYPKDVMYWEEWPVAHPFLLFGYHQYPEKSLLESWLTLAHFPQVEEVIRNLPIRNPLIWMGQN